MTFLLRRSSDGRAAGFEPARRWFESSRLSHNPVNNTMRTRDFQNSGRTLTPDLGGKRLLRRVQCGCVGCEGCERGEDGITGCASSVDYTHGDPTELWADGWGSWWNKTGEDARRTWRCRGCYKEPEAPTGTPSYHVHHLTLTIAHRTPSDPERKALEAMVKVLLVNDPSRAEHMLREIVYRAPSRRRAKGWRELMSRGVKA